MKPTFELHKLPEGFIVTSDETPKNKEVYWCKHKGKGIDVGFGQPKQVLILNIMSEGRNLCSDCKKLIAQQDQIDFSGLSEKDQKKIGFLFDDLDKMSIEWHKKEYGFTPQLQIIKAYAAGFQKAQEVLSDRVFTLEDMRESYNQGMKNQSIALEGLTYDRNFEVLINDIQIKSWKVELEMEEKCCGLLEDTCKNDNLKSVCDFCSKRCNFQPKLTNGKIKILKLL